MNLFIFMLNKERLLKNYTILQGIISVHNSFEATAVKLEIHISYRQISMSQVDLLKGMITQRCQITG